MKAILFTSLIFLISVFHLFSQGQWEVVQTPVSENFTAVWVVDETKIIIVSDQGTLIGTDDGGATWYDTWFAGAGLTSIWFSDANNGAILSSGSIVKIYKTNDGGENWQDYTVDTLDAGNAVFFTNQNNGYVAGSYDGKNNIRISIDGGQSWGSVFMPYIMGSVFNDIYFRNEVDGNIVGTDGTFYSTADGGEIWAMNISFPAVDLNAIYNFGEQFGVVVGDGGTSFFTINDWYQHTEINSPVSENLNAVSGAPGSNKIWAVGDEGTILYLDNYLLGWSVQNSGTTENLNDVFILNENFGVAVGDNGTVLFMSNPNFVDDLKTDVALSVFPNPVSNKSVIRYNVTSKGNISLNIYDLLGNEVIHLFDGEKPAGRYKIAFNSSGLQNGIYFVGFSAGNQIVFKKVIIVRQE